MASSSTTSVSPLVQRRKSVVVGRGEDVHDDARVVVFGRSTTSVRMW
jgi:hypothetical protein